MPLFPISEDSEAHAYLAGAAYGELRIVEDRETGELLDPLVDVSSDPHRYRFIAATGSGRVVSWSVGHHRSDSGIVRHLFGIVELDEGPWIWSELRGPEPWVGLTGRVVTVRFARTGAEPGHATLPHFVFD